MEKEICKLFEDKKILLKNLKDIDLSKFTKKRTYKCYYGVDTKSFYTIVLIRNAKSRFLLKEFEFIEELHFQICIQTGVNIKKLVCFYNSDICSKTLNAFKQKGWKSYAFV